MSSSVRDNFKKGVKGLQDYIVLAAADARKYQSARQDILRQLTLDEKLPGVYVALNKPYDIVLRELGKDKVDTRTIIFIDCITKTESGSKTKLENCIFINSPEKLTDIFVAMDQAVNSITSKEKFVFFDSINTLLLFNQQATVIRFAHQLVVKMRSWKVKGIIMTIEREAESELLDEITPFCDLRIDAD